MMAYSDLHRGIIAMEALAEASTTVAKRLDELPVRGPGMMCLLHLAETIADYTNLLALDVALEGSRERADSREFILLASDARQQAVRISLAMRHILSELKKLQPESLDSAQARAKAFESCLNLASLASRTEKLYRPLCPVTTPARKTRLPILPAMFPPQEDANTNRHLTS